MNPLIFALRNLSDHDSKTFDLLLMKMKNEDILEAFRIYRIVNTTKIEGVVRICSDVFNVDISEVKGLSRKSEVIKARCALYLFLVLYRGWTRESAGAICGQDHATVCHQLNKLYPEFIHDQKFRDNYDKFLALAHEFVAQSVLLPDK